MTNVFQWSEYLLHLYHLKLVIQFQHFNPLPGQALVSAHSVTFVTSLLVMIFVYKQKLPTVSLRPVLTEIK